MKVFISDEPTNAYSYECIETNSILEFLQSKFDKFPATARIYHKSIAISNDVTPKTDDDVEQLSKLEGPFYVIVYPGDPVTIIVAIVAIAATAAVAFLLKPKIPQAVSTDTQSEVGSSNNQLSSRQNQARLNGRVPDIYGQVRSIPDLITLPYTFFDTASIEYELSYMCIGRGYYSISDVKEGATPYSSNLGGCLFYNPGSSPISGSPFLSIGAGISYNLMNYSRLAAINGDTAKAAGSGVLTLTSFGASYLKLINASTGARINNGNWFISYPQTGNTNPADLFIIGDSVTVASSTFPALNGTYSVVSMYTQKVYNGTIKDGYILELSPQNTSVDDGVAVASGIYGNVCVNSRSLSVTKVGTSNVLGPFDITDTNATQALINYIAPSGIYGGASDVQIKVTTTSVPGGTVVNYTHTLARKTDYNGFKGYTFEIPLPGACTIKFERITAKLAADTDEIKIRDVFYGKALTGSYSDVTTVLVMSKQTQTATSVDERKFNCLAFRKIETRVSGTTFSGSLSANNWASEIIASICLDPVIGRRSVAELDLDSIYDNVWAAYMYFGLGGGTAEIPVFNYTFDKTGISFEETIASVAAAVHCVAYRQGNKIKLKFERANSTAALLLNHRNIIPQTQQRAISFGVTNDYDGVKFKYIDPNTDQETVMYVPNTSIVNPKDVEYIGIRNKVQAYYLAWRAWNRLKYQNIALQFEALQETDLLVVTDKILVSDLTRNDTYDGEVVNQVGLTIYLSVDVTVANGDTIFFQYADGTTGSRTITNQAGSNAVIINSAPAVSLITDIDKYARTGFIIQRIGSQVNLPFIVTEKSPSAKFTNELKVINYSSSYYANDNVNPATI